MKSCNESIDRTGVSETSQSEAGLTLFFAVAEEWNLPKNQQRKLLGNPDLTTLDHWKETNTGTLTGDTLNRLSHFAGIYRVLTYIFPDSEKIIEWLTNKNENVMFLGLSPLEYMANGSLTRLANVRRYLEAKAE